MDTNGTDGTTRAVISPTAQLCATIGTTLLGLMRLLDEGHLRIDEDSVAEYLAARGR